MKTLLIWVKMPPHRWDADTEVVQLLQKHFPVVGDEVRVQRLDMKAQPVYVEITDILPYENERGIYCCSPID